MTQEVRTTEDTKPAPPVAEPPPGGDDAGEMTLEPEERTPEEAGYGYGV
ncbi:MAG TPA: hypothetical protein VH417_13320 [Vicinamibacterales bacterium]